MMPQTNFYAFFDRPTQQNLDSNKTGRLTPDQQTALKKGVRQQWWRVVLWVFVLLVLCGAFSLFFYALISGGDLESSQQGPALGAAFAISIALLVLGAFLFPDLRLVLASGDIEAGQVDSVSGKIVWTRRRYQVVSDSRTLRTVRGNVSMPPPGAYRFYCLPNSGLVIQAELVESASSGNSNDLLLDALSQAHRFSIDDLAENRRGFLTGGQTLRLIGYIIGQGVLFLAVAAFAAGLYFSMTTSSTNSEDLVWISVFGIMVLIFGLGAVWNVLKALIDLFTRTVSNEEGFVMRREHRTRNGRYYTYQIKSLKFRVSRTAFQALVDGWEYRVYYSPRSKRLLAIEPLRQAQMIISEDMTR